MSIDIKTLKDTIVEEKLATVSSRVVLSLFDEIDRLEQSVNDWKAALKLVSDHRDKALDALTVTQEEWLLRVKSLDLQVNNLKSMNELLRKELSQRANDTSRF